MRKAPNPPPDVTKPTPPPGPPAIGEQLRTDNSTECLTILYSLIDQVEKGELEIRGLDFRADLGEKAVYPDDGWRHLEPTGRRHLHVEFLKKQ